MFIKGEVELIYQTIGEDDDGSPVKKTWCRTIRCDEMETFGNNYYTSQQRNMRLSRNLVVPAWVCDDVFQYGYRFELMYVNYLCRRYKVHSILKYRASRQSVKNTRQLMVLDIQEVR